MKLATKLTVILMSLVALAHLVRFFAGWEVLVSGWPFPVWGSLFGALIPGLLAFFVVREHAA